MPDTDRDHEHPARQREELFAEHRAYLFAVAYRMLGMAQDAEDVLQDTWIRFAAAEAHAIQHPRTYLVTIATRLCLDLLRSARRQREEYVGTWLPEPVPTREAVPDDLLEKAESASFAFLLLLERLSPLQRAVLVLHDVFDYTHDEIGRTIGRSEDASRQLLRRARLGLGGQLPAPAPPSDETSALASRFCEAARAGDVEELIRALAPDVVLMSDGGGKVSAISRPLAGNQRVGAFLGTARRQAAWGPVELVELNGQPALLTYENGDLTNALVLDVTRDGITAIYAVRNPDKLPRRAYRARLDLTDD